MDQFHAMSSELLAQPIDVSAVMEGYLDDLNQLDQAYEVTLNQIKGGAKQAIDTAIKFAKEAAKRLWLLIQSGLQSMLEFGQALGNMTHIKAIRVPRELGEAFIQMMLDTKEMTDDSAEYVNGMMTYYKQYTDAVDSHSSTNWANTAFAEQLAEQTRKMKETIGAIKDKDPLLKTSADEYMKAHADMTQWDFAVEPAKQQRLILGMRAKWSGLKTSILAMSRLIDRSFEEQKSGYGTAGARMLTDQQAMMRKVYSGAMSKVTGVLQMLNYLQHYISFFIRLAKTYGTKGNAIDSDEIEGRIPKSEPVPFDRALRSTT